MSIAPVPQIFTYQTRIGPDAALDTCADLYGRIERKVFADIQRGEQPGSLKSTYLRHYDRNGFHLTLHPQMLTLPLSWKKPQIIFVNSMSDLFQDEVPEEYIQQVFAVMRSAHWHQFQVLTKRAERLAAVSPAIDWLPNVWMGVSVEIEKYTFRIDSLRKTGAHIKFLSLEPLLGPLPELTLTGIDWVIKSC